MENTLNIRLDKLSEEDRKKFFEIIEKCKSGSDKKLNKPKEGDVYWFIGFDGKVDNTTWTNGEIDNNMYSIGNYFKSKGDADFEVERMRVVAELKRYAEEHNTEEIDWSECGKKKWYIYCSNDSTNRKCICLDYCYGRQLIDNISFTSKEIAKQAVKEIGEDRIKKYLFSDYNDAN